MRQYIRHFFCLTIAMVMAMPNLVAQVDLQKSFYVMHNDSTGVTGKLEGGEWLIRFSDTDSLGNQYSSPVAMNVEAVYYGDTTYIEMQTVDSVLFEVPEDEMKPGVFELTEDHFKYIIGSDSATTIRFRIDCLTKVDLPTVGQKVYCDIMRGHLPYGFVGLVESLNGSYDEGFIQLKCKQIPLCEVFTKYYRAGFSGSDTLYAEAKRRGGFVAPQRRLDPEIRTSVSAGTQGEVFTLPLNIKQYIAFLFNEDIGKKIDVTAGSNYTVVSGILDNEYGSKWRTFPYVGVELDLKGSFGCYYTAIIDAQNNRDYTDIWFHHDINGRISPRFSISLPFKASHPYPLLTPMIPVLPGITANGEFGFKVDFDASLVFGLDFNISHSATYGLSIDGLNTKPIFETNTPSTNGGVAWNVDTRLTLKGSLFIGPYFTVGAGVGGKVANLDAGLSIGPRLDASVDMVFNLEGDQFDKNMMVDWKEIDLAQNKYKGMSSSGIKFEAAFYPVGTASLAADWLHVDLWETLTTFLDIDPAILKTTIFDLKVYPSFSNLQIDGLKNDKCIFSFTKNKSFTSCYAGYFLKDATPTTEDTSIPLYLSDTKKMSSDSETANFEINFEPHYRGKLLRVYPYFQVLAFLIHDFQNFIPGNYAEVYVPILFDFDKEYPKPDFDFCKVKYNIEDYYAITQKENYVAGFAIYDEKQNEINKKEIPFDESLEVNIEREADAKGLLKGYVAAYIYDKANDKTFYSDKRPFLIYDYYDPKTHDAGNITTSGATVWAELNSTLVEQIKNGQNLNVQVGFQIQKKYTGEDPRDVWTNAITIPFTDSRYSYQFVDLEPGMPYDYCAMVKYDGKVYKGEIKSFTTLPIVQGLDATNIGPSRAYLLAEIAKSEDFKTTSVMFQFSEDETFKTTIDVTTEGSDWDFDSETDYYPVSKECDGLVPETEYYYRLAWVRNGEERLRYSEAKTFTTEPPLKNLTHSALGSTRMVIAADIAKIFEDRHFELQLSTNKEDWPYYKYTVEKEESDSPDYNSFTFEVKDLESQKKYYYRFRCWLGSKEYYSEIKSFTMPKPDLSPTVADVKVTGNSVKITGLISQDLHDKQPTHLYFVVATKKDYSMSDNSTQMVTVPFEKGKLKYEAEFSGLQYDKTYYCTLVAGTIVEEWARADMKSFKTDKNPADTQSCITLDPVVKSDTVTFVGKINDATTLSLFRSAEYPNSAVGFELFKGEGLTNAESDYIVFVVDKTTGEFRSEDNRLQPETTYTYRAFVNLTGDKRVYSENSITFKTDRYDGDLVIPDAKKRQGDLDK